MQNKRIIKEISEEVKRKLIDDSSGHDWWHTYRVWKMAKYISQKESADIFIVELAALLHDIADWKFFGGDNTVGSKTAKKLLSKYKIDQNTIDHVCDIIETVSFEGAKVKSKMKTKEEKVVQDADRLDAIGAIGIARTFAYTGSKGRLMHDPSKKPVMHSTKEKYLNSNSSAINHFYEKLLLLKILMNTKTAKKIANERHKFMEIFLKRFYEEWEGKI